MALLQHKSVVAPPEGARNELIILFLVIKFIFMNTGRVKMQIHWSPLHSALPGRNDLKGPLNDEPVASMHHHTGHPSICGMAAVKSDGTQEDSTGVHTGLALEQKLFAQIYGV